MEAELNIAEIPYESGGVHFRYSRVLSEDGARWVRHGMFVEYSENGTVIAEGSYSYGKEQGRWREYYPNGGPAAEGAYEAGLEHGAWKFWDEAGNVRQTNFVHGVEHGAAA